MFSFSLSQFQHGTRQRLIRDDRGSVSVELVIVLPLLLWALAATAVFYDGFRSRYATQSAAYTVADAMSRQTDTFSETYMEGMNNMFDFLAATATDTRMRISSVSFDATEGQFELEWSYGTRGLTPLPDNTFELLANNDLATLEAAFGDGTGLQFANSSVQMPVADLASRIPTILPGESILLVETFAIWTPFASVGLGEMRLNTLVPIRSRFAAQQVLEGENGSGGSGGGIDPNEVVDQTLAPPTPQVDIDLNDPNLSITQVYANNFDTHSAGSEWTTNSIGSNGPSGSFLGPFGAETWDNPVRLETDLGNASDIVEITFDLILFDTWDGYSSFAALPRGDTMIFTLNGVPFSVEAFHERPSGIYGNDRLSANFVGNAWLSTQMTLESYGQNFGNGLGPDQRWSVRIVGRNMPQNLVLGFSAGLSSWLLDEAFGIDNLQINAGRATPWTPRVNVDASTAIATSPYTQMPFFDGCPDPRYPAQWLSMSLTQTDPRLEISRTAVGTTALAQCPDVPDTGYNMMPPSLVLSYDNENMSGPGNNLRIISDDGFSGQMCDTTLLVRDPNGQWFFNDDFSGYNPAVSLHDPLSGTYHIYVGSFNSGTCDSQLRFERY